MTELLPRDQVFISKLTEIIITNLGNENFDVKELASQSGLSHYSLSRKIYAITNKTAREFIRETRLLKALEMLRNEEFTVAEVAYKVGFSSPSYFNTCFHEFFGYSPGKVKNAEFSPSGKGSSYPKAGRGRQQLPTAGTSRIYIISAGIVFSVFLAYLGYNYLVKDSTQTSGVLMKGHEKSIAVMPFINLSDSSANQYFIDGVMEEILASLSRIHELRVISRTSVEQFRKNTKSAAEIGKKLNVDYIVEGSGQKYGNAFRLRVQLIETSTDKHIWAKSYQQEIIETKDIFKIQSQVAQSIAAELKSTISTAEKQLINKIPTSDLTAYDFYLKGEEELKKKGWDSKNRQTNKRAEEFFYKALEYDSTYALAYIGLSKAYIQKYYFKSFFSSNFLDTVLILTNRALSFDDQLAEGYFLRGQYYYENGKPDKAVKEWEKALKYNPNYWEAYSSLGYNIYILNYHYADFVKGLLYLHKAVSIYHGTDRPWLLRDHLGDAYGFYAGFPEKQKYYYEEAFTLDNDTNSMNIFKTDLEAIESFKKSNAKDSGNLYIMFSIVNRYNNLGQYKESLEFVKKMEKFPDGQIMTLPGSYYIFGYVYLQNGFKEEAYKWFNKQVKTSEESLKLGRYLGIGANLNLAATYAVMEENEKAYENLRIVAKPRVCGYWLLSLLKDSCFNSIRNEPEFHRIVSELESKYNAEHERVRKWMEEQGLL